MSQSIFVIELQFASPEEVAQGLNLFYESYSEKIDDVIAVTNYVTAHQDTTKSIAMPGVQPKVQYVFRFIITYTGTQILNPNKS